MPASKPLSVLGTTVQVEQNDANDGAKGYQRCEKYTGGFTLITRKMRHQQMHSATPTKYIRASYHTDRH